MAFDGGTWREETLLQQAILQTLVYADLFDYPLTPGEIVRYLSLRADPASILEQIDRSAVEGRLVRHNGYVALPGRDGLFALREHREQVASRKWLAARRYARWLAQTPFVRMVAVTGTLAVNNVESQDDIDVLVITEPGRLWLCRLLVIVSVRLAALVGDELCPNYFLSQRQLIFPDHTMFGAREVAQMVPLYGPDVYWQIRDLNCWTGDFLPQAAGLPELAHQTGPGGEVFQAMGWLSRGFKRVVERLLSGSAGARLERWEMERKVRKLNEQAQVRGGNVLFTADCCKGHFARHDTRIMRNFEAGLAQHGLRDA